MRLHAASGGPLSGGDRECLSISDMPRAKQGRVQGVVATPDLGGVAGGSSGSFTALGRFARRADGWLLSDPGRQSGFEQSFDLQHDVYV